MNGPFYPGAGVVCVNAIQHGLITISPGAEGICCGPETDGPTVYWSKFNVTTVCRSEDVKLKLEDQREQARYAFAASNLPTVRSEYAERNYEEFATQPGIKASPLPDNHAVTRGLAERGQVKFRAKGTIYRKEGKNGVDVLISEQYESPDVAEAVGGVLYGLDLLRLQSFLADGAYLHIECERVN